MKLTIFISILLVSGYGMSCHSRKNEATEKAPAPPDPHEDEPEHEALPEKIRLTPQLIQAAGIKLQAVQYETLPQTLELTGEIAAEPDKTSEVSARVPGRIVQVHFKEGQRVQKGDVLAVVESAELASARAQFISMQAKAQAARAQLQRLKQLSQDGLASGQEIANAQSEDTTLQAELRAARLKLTAFGAEAAQSLLDGARIKIRATLSGDILKRQAIVGQTVEANHTLAVIGDLDTAHFVARLLEKDLAFIQVRASADVQLNAYPQEVFSGTVETIGKQLDPMARTVVARIRVKNKNDLLKVGLFGTAKVSIPDVSAGKKRLVVPQTALTDVADKKVVFVGHADGDFEMHPVTMGASGGGKIEIITGLRENEQVVVSGVFTLKSVVLKSTFGEEEE